jgi:hypothetical protein
MPLLDLLLAFALVLGSPLLDTPTLEIVAYEGRNRVFRRGATAG